MSDSIAEYYARIERNKARLKYKNNIIRDTKHMSDIEKSMKIKVKQIENFYNKGKSYQKKVIAECGSEDLRKWF